MKKQNIIILVIINLLFSCNSENQSSEKKNTPTWTKEIAPLIHENCMPCHRPKGGGPFNFIEYRDVVKRKKMVRYVTGIKYMPPWPADKNYSHFVDERGLEESEIQLIKDWVDAGAPFGDSSIVVTPPNYNEKSQVGEPDLTLTVRDSFLIPGDNLDKFIMVKVPYELEEEKYVKAIEFVPGNRNFVHHMNGHLVSYKEGKKRDVQEGIHVLDYYNLDDNIDRFATMGLANDDGTYPELLENVCNYLPSVVPPIYPKGIGGFTMPKKGAFLMNDMHFGPTPKDEWDQSSFNIFFTDEKPKRPMKEFYLGTYGVSPVIPDLIIEPGEIKKVHSKFRLKQDISMLTINPHMHLIGVSFKAYAVTPIGDTIPLINIPKWDFRWQYYYTFEKIMVLKKGTLLYCEGVYDNTKNNPWNPYNPPRVIRDRKFNSMKTTDEMFQFIIMYVDYQKGDEHIVLGER